MLNFNRYALVSGLIVIVLGVLAGAVTIPHTVIQGGGTPTCSVQAVAGLSGDVNSIVYVYYSGFSVSPVSAQVNFGNGLSSGTFQSYNSPASAGTRYSPGTYTVSASVSDQYGETCSASTSVTVAPTTGGVVTTTTTTAVSSGTLTQSQTTSPVTTTTTPPVTTTTTPVQTQTYTAVYVSTSTSTYVTQATVTSQGQTTVIQTTLSSTYTTQVTTTGITSVSPTGPNTPVNGALILLGLFLAGLAAVPFILKRSRLAES